MVRKRKQLENFTVTLSNALLNVFSFNLPTSKNGAWKAVEFAIYDQISNIMYEELICKTARKL